MAVKDGTISFKGRTCKLGKRIGGGLEGDVYIFETNVTSKQNPTPHPKTFAAKVIHTENLNSKRIEEIHNHLEWLCEKTRNNVEVRKHLASPIALLDGDLGYVMNFANEHIGLNDFLNPPDDFDSWYTSSHSLKRRYQIIANLFSALRDIHLAGLVFTDLSPNNIMVHKTENQLVFIDTDNMRRRTDAYSGVLGTPGFMAPEVIRPIHSEIDIPGLQEKIRSECGKITSDSDIFSAAVIAFKLLTFEHPFVGDIINEGTPEDQERAFNIETDYVLKEGTENTLTFPFIDKFNEITTPEIRSLFARTFIQGKENPGMRPTDEEFSEAFQKALDLIVKCDHCGYERIYAPGDNNYCFNTDCAHPFEKKIMMTNFIVLKDLKISDLINSIGKFPQYDVTEEELSLRNASPIEELKAFDRIEVSRMILEPGAANTKFLYRRHFESTTQRGKAIAQIALSDTGDKASIRILENETFPNVYLIENKKQTIKPLLKDKIYEFDWSEYTIVFDNQKREKGSLQILSEFRRL